MDERIAQMKRLEGEKKMSKVSMKGVIDMHVHTNPDLRLRAYDDFEMMEAGIRVGARAIVLKTHQGTTMDRAYLCNRHNEGSISRAAEKLYMAQSSLSQFLQLYEAELGAPLFMRTSRGVRPTASGSVFKPCPPDPPPVPPGPKRAVGYRRAFRRPYRAGDQHLPGYLSAAACTQAVP